MAGELRWRQAALLLPCAPHGDAGGQQRGLGEFGAVELLFRAFLGQRPEIRAGAFAGFRERRAHDRFARSEVGEHAERLRALSGEDESEVWLVHGRVGGEKERR